MVALALNTVSIRHLGLFGDVRYTWTDKNSG